MNDHKNHNDRTQYDTRPTLMATSTILYWGHEARV